jgi:hypothetical protein
MSNYYEDARGVIQDLLGPVDSVTWITTKKGAIRGNHVHHTDGSVDASWSAAGC